MGCRGRAAISSLSKLWPRYHKSTFVGSELRVITSNKKQGRRRIFLHGGSVHSLVGERPEELRRKGHVERKKQFHSTSLDVSVKLNFKQAAEMCTNSVM